MRRNGFAWVHNLIENVGEANAKKLLRQRRGKKGEYLNIGSIAKHEGSTDYDLCDAMCVGRPSLEKRYNVFCRFVRYLRFKSARKTTS